MTQAGIELVTAGRRRRWTRADKERLVAASFEPGVSTSDVARRTGLHISQLFRWRTLLCERAGAPTRALVPVVTAPATAVMTVEPG
ncbi:transposase [Methylobacterium sp. C25]|uniref:transposase n=1 Tax=Methylobacterium sp. C25 TaxID=2721622 RepID=UPI003FA3D6DA